MKRFRLPTPWTQPTSLKEPCLTPTDGLKRTVYSESYSYTYDYYYYYYCYYCYYYYYYYS